MDPNRVSYALDRPYWNVSILGVVFFVDIAFSIIGWSYHGRNRLHYRTILYPKLFAVLALGISLAASAGLDGSNGSYNNNTEFFTAAKYYAVASIVVSLYIYSTHARAGPTTISPLRNAPEVSRKYNRIDEPVTWTTNRETGSSVKGNTHVSVIKTISSGSLTNNPDYSPFNPLHPDNIKGNDYTSQTMLAAAWFLTFVMATTASVAERDGYRLLFTLISCFGILVCQILFVWHFRIAIYSEKRTPALVARYHKKMPTLKAEHSYLVIQSISYNILASVTILTNLAIVTNGVRLPDQAIAHNILMISFAVLHLVGTIVHELYHTDGASETDVATEFELHEGPSLHSQDDRDFPAIVKPDVTSTVVHPVRESAYLRPMHSDRGSSFYK